MTMDHYDMEFPNTLRFVSSIRIETIARIPAIASIRCDRAGVAQR